MSISFYPATTEGRPLLRCTCDLDAPAEAPLCPACKATVSLCGSNALDVLQWLGVTLEIVGQTPARNLAARCRRRLWDEPRNSDPVVPAEERLPGVSSHGGARFVVLDRRAGYLREQAGRLLEVAEMAADGLVCWG